MQQIYEGHTRRRIAQDIIHGCCERVVDNPVSSEERVERFQALRPSRSQKRHGPSPSRGARPPPFSTSELSPPRYGRTVREERYDAPEFLRRLRTGEVAAFEELVAAYQHRVFGVALRMLGSAAEAEEIAQDVFLRAYRALHDFRGDAKLSTWLYAIASRLCLTRLGSNERGVTRGDGDRLARLPDPGAGPEAALERGERDAALLRAIAELPDERRIVVVLRDLEGLSYEEIAGALDLELGTVRSRLHRARMDLKDKLERFLT
ncbi:MAG: hypothetical protein C5B48_03210 [Candidatus Rokuibacteriota bacterium]|nr:MAG: hypothetical protein C5B48_03210 [Candidatus Rokubacteria bacterium]